MTTSHTPGPWIINIRTVREGFCDPGIWIHNDSGTVVDTGAIREHPLSEADRTLIAAAPELLEALRECITEDGARCLANTEHPGLLVRRIQAINAAARAAIARAEGRQ